MFESYSREHAAPGRRQGLLGSTAAAVAIYGLLGAAALTLARDVVREVVAPVTEVIFAPSPEPAAKPSAPPPAKRARPRAKMVAPDPPPALTPPEPTTPVTMPNAPAPEADPNAARPSGGEPDDGAVGLVDPHAKPGGSTSAGALEDTIMKDPGGELGVKPSRANKAPQMPEEARRKGLTGLVIVKVIIGKDGGVRSVQVLQGDPLFAQAAIEAIKAWRFEPARYNGVPVAVYKIYKIPFVLSDNQARRR